MPIIQAVLFDLGGTLLHYDQPPEHTFEAINSRALRAFVQSAMAHGVKVPDHSNRAEMVIREGLEAVGIRMPDKVFDAAMAAYYQAISDVVIPVGDDTASVLQEIVDQGRQLALVSNTLWAPEMHDADLTRNGLIDFLPVRVYSSCAGFVKPDERIFRQALDRFDVAPAEAVYIGDKLDVDVAGPQKIGMRAILVRSPYRAEVSDEIIPDAVIDSLAELPGLLEAWDRAIETQATVPPR
jgi:FMN phosphatase YigB (HAD superfamily)